MKRYLLRSIALATCAISGSGLARAAPSERTYMISIPAADLKTALDDYVKQTGLQLVYRSDELRGVHSHGARGNLSAAATLQAILSETGFQARTDSSGATAIVRIVGNAPPILGTTEAAGTGDQEIVVTARRVEESSQRVPVAVTALTGKSLRELHINSRDELTQHVAGLTDAAGGAAGEQGGIFLIRGQGESFGGTPGVITYFADVPGIALGNQNQSPLSIDGRPGTYIDLQNVQVLKGPQGTLFGRNATGGNILFVPQRPTDRLEGYVTGGVGNYRDVDFEAALNIPLVGDKLLARVAGGIERRDGFVKDVITGAEAESLNYRTLRASLLFRPSANFEDYLIGRYYESHDGGPAFILTQGNPDPSLNPEFAQLAAEQTARGPYSVSYGPETNYSKTRYWQLINTSTWSLLPQLTLKNIISYARFSNAYSTDVDGTTLGILEQTSRYRPAPENGIFTEELQASGKLLSGNLTYAIGLYADHAGTITPFIQDFQFYPFIPGIFPPIPDNTVPGLVQFPQFPAMLYFNDTSSNKAVYGQASLDLGLVSPTLKGLSLTAGGRYTRERTTSDDWTVLSTIAAIHSVARYRNSYPSFTFGIDYQASPTTLLYASVRDAYKSGGINAQLDASSPVHTYAPEKLVSYETGVKTHFGSPVARFLIDADAFLGDYTNMQRSIFDPSVAPGGFINNVSQARIKGVEVDASARLFQRLNLGLSYAYTDSAYTKITDPAAVASLTGAPFPNVAKNRYNISAEYWLPFIPAAAGEVRIYVNHTYQSKISFSQSNAPSVAGQFLPGFGLWNAGLNWDGFAGVPKLSLNAYVRNLANRAYVLSRFDFYSSDGFVSSQYGEPRTYGMRIRYAF